MLLQVETRASRFRAALGFQGRFVEHGWDCPATDGVDASAPFPKFVIPCSTLCHELRKQRGTSKNLAPVPLRFEVPDRVCRSRHRNFKSAALATPRFQAGRK